VLHLHIAHGQGNYVADPETLDELEAEDRVVFRYVDDEGEATDEGNANGSMNNIAGIINEHGQRAGADAAPRTLRGAAARLDGRAAVLPVDRWPIA
jgi:phosphoribosylformylglycinamidine synthase subunit PurQ / glutaminase